INSVSQAEGNSGSTTLTFTVSALPVSAQPITVDYATVDGTATAPDDYTSTSGTLTIPANAGGGTITVPVNGDTTPDPDDTFTVNLSSPTNAGISNGIGTGTIKN